MHQYIFATESYPFSADLASLLPQEPDECVLVTKDVHHTLRDEDRRRFARIVEVDRFDWESLDEAFARASPRPGAHLVSHDDFFYDLLAELGPRYGMSIYSLQSILPFVDKHVMKQRLGRSNVRLPRYRLFDATTCTIRGDDCLREIAGELGYPMFAKPLRGAGAEGCSLIVNEEQFIGWARGFHVDASYEIDEFVSEAVLYHCDSVLVGGRPVFTEVCRYSHPCAEFAKGRMVGSYTLDERDEWREPLIRAVGDVFEAFGSHHPVPDGVAHMELFGTAAGEVIFLEVQFRPPGANVRRAYAERLRLNLEEIHYRLQMGVDAPAVQSCGPHAAWMYFPTGDGVVHTVESLPELHSRVVECSYCIQPGQRTHAPHSILDARGRGVVALSLVISNHDHRQLRSDFERLCHHTPFQLLR